MLKKAGLPETIRFHDLRHSCATLLIAQGVHPRVVMEILRHSQISTTMNTYAHVLPRLQRDATTKIEELIDGAAEDTAAKEGGDERVDGDAEAPRTSDESSDEDKGEPGEEPRQDG